jgi:hypothetical protein
MVEGVEWGQMDNPRPRLRGGSRVTVDGRAGGKRCDREAAEGSTHSTTARDKGKEGESGGVLRLAVLRGLLVLVERATERKTGGAAPAQSDQSSSMLQ